MDTSTLLFGVLFGSIGMGFFVYGKKQQAFVPLLSGIALMISPYFISNPYLMALTGLGLVVLPFFLKV